MDIAAAHHDQVGRGEHAPRPAQVVGERPPAHVPLSAGEARNAAIRILVSDQGKPAAIAVLGPLG
jgi:hypothetical protein